MNIGNSRSKFFLIVFLILFLVLFYWKDVRCFEVCRRHEPFSFDLHSLKIVNWVRMDKFYALSSNNFVLCFLRRF